MGANPGGTDRSVSLKLRQRRREQTGVAIGDTQASHCATFLENLTGNCLGHQPLLLKPSWHASCEPYCMNSDRTQRHRCPRDRVSRLLAAQAVISIRPETRGAAFARADSLLYTLSLLDARPRSTSQLWMDADSKASGDQREIEQGLDLPSGREFRKAYVHAKVCHIHEAANCVLIAIARARTSRLKTPRSNFTPRLPYVLHTAQTGSS